jgi:hypothetical protein
MQPLHSLRAICTSGLFLLSIWPASADTCSPPTVKYSAGLSALTAADAGALLLIGNPVASKSRIIDVQASRSISVFQSGCWRLNSALRNDMIWFAINNQSTGTAPSNYIAVQVLRIFKPSANVKPSALVTANRASDNKHQWFRGDQPTTYGADAKPISSDIEKWNGAHAYLNVVQQSDALLQGKWHGSISKNGLSTWDNRTWWQVNSTAQTQYVVVLENRLMPFDIATSKAGIGIPFFLRPNGFDAFVIRYASPAPEQNGEVRFCFSLCEEIAALETSTQDKGLLAGLLSIFRGH